MFYPQENSTSEYNYMHNKIIFHVQAAHYVFTGTTFIIQALQDRDANSLLPVTGELFHTEISLFNCSDLPRPG